MSNPHMESLAKTVGRNAHAQRQKLGLKEPDLMARGVPAGTAHRATAGDPEAKQDMKLSTLERLAKALEVPAWALLVPMFDADDPPKLLFSKEIEAEIVRRTNARGIGIRFGKIPPAWVKGCR